MDSAAEELGILCGKKLPLIERLGHDHWKVRQLAYDSLRTEFTTNGSLELLFKYAPILMGECLREPAPEAFNSLLSTLLYYVKEAPLAVTGRFSTEHQRMIIHILVTLREKGSWEIMPTFAIDATPMICHLLDTAVEMDDSTTYLVEAIALLSFWARNVSVRKKAVINACSGHALFLKEFHRLCDDNTTTTNSDEAGGETLMLFRPSQQYSLLTEVSPKRNLDALEYWSMNPPTRKSVAGMDTPELAECIAAFVLHYNPRNAHRYVAVRDVLCEFFDRQSITGASLVGPFRLSEETFTREVLGAFERDPRIKRRLGDVPTLRRLHAALEKDVEVMQVEEEEFENVSEYPEEDDECDGNDNDDEMKEQEKVSEKEKAEQEEDVNALLEKL